ncbi:MAG TPA: hypothetical protein VIF15_20810 [Polyangiaceae bacterium]
MRWFHVGAPLALLVATWSAGSEARADPQASLGVTVGGAVEDVSGPRSPEGAFHLGGRGDVLFLRNRAHDMAVGPYVDVASAGFHDLDAGGGAEWLLPVTDDMPLVLSAGGFARNGEGRTWSPGMEGTVFFGSRSYNFHSWYGLAAGLFAQSRWLPASPATLDLVFGVQIDGQLLALPFLFVFEAIAH